MIALFSGPALVFISVDFASLLTSVKRERRAFTLGVLVLANTRFYLYKHTHVDTLTPHYLKRGETNSS